MTRRSDFGAVLARQRLIAIVRLGSNQWLVPTARAIALGGVEIIEFPLTSPNALDALRIATAELPDAVCLGAGTVLDRSSVHAAIAAGARFIVSPTLNEDVMMACKESGIPCLPGAFTPTEVLLARDRGADLVKLFPAGVLGAGYVRDVLATMPTLRLVPTGGIDLENAKSYLDAGAAAVAVGSALADPRLAAAEDWPAITANARQFLTATHAVVDG